MNKNFRFLTILLLSFALMSVYACEPAPEEAPQNAVKSDAQAEATEPAKLAKATKPETKLAAKPLPPIVLDDEGEYPWYNEKIGALKKGQTTQEVEKILGAPGQKGDEEFMPATGEYQVFWTYKDAGINLVFAASEKDAPRTLAQMSLFAPATLKTQRGIGLGSTRAEVEAAYEKPTFPPKQGAKHSRYAADESNDGQVVVGSAYGGLVFYIEDGRVSGIFLGASAE